MTRNRSARHRGPYRPLVDVAAAARRHPAPRRPRHRAPVPFEVRLERELDAHDGSLASLLGLTPEPAR